jgi:hypothetical protein
MRGVLFSAIGIVSIFVVTPVYPGQEAKQDDIEWSNIWIFNANKSDRPHILLVGDSIVEGYFPLVQARLSSKANCSRYTTGKFLGDPDYLRELSGILKRYKFDVIHINNGLHGMNYTDKEYKEGLYVLLRTLKRYNPKAKLIWGMTTPIRTTENLSQFKSEANSRVVSRDLIATEIMSHNKIPIDDLYGVVKDHPEYYEKDGVHFIFRGRLVLANKVAEVIEENLSNKPPSVDSK